MMATTAAALRDYVRVYADLLQAATAATGAPLALARLEMLSLAL